MQLSKTYGEIVAVDNISFHVERNEIVGPWGACLAVLYILLACWFFTRVYRHAVQTGLIARYSAETLS
jgi:hypothetical protein